MAGQARSLRQDDAASSSFNSSSTAYTCHATRVDNGRRYSEQDGLAVERRSDRTTVLHKLAAVAPSSNLTLTVPHAFCGH